MMILQSLNDYIKKMDRVAEDKLLKKFHLSREGLAPMIAVLLKRGNIRKVVLMRGEHLPAQIFYSWSDTLSIPTISVV